MKVAIIGIARSGTTALYSLLQEIMADVHKEVQFIYEPFLWDKDVFNGKYNEVSDKFNTLDSISVEGIYHHQTLPLFINNPHEYAENKYLKDLFRPENSEVNILSKIIRANGRCSLLHQICPDMKLIYIIRNPLDSVNSILSLFSYYGGEFHHDDFPRFMQGLADYFGQHQTIETGSGQIGKELLYWYFMNKFALQTITQTQFSSLIISHENYSDNPEIIVKSICEFLQYPVKDEYYQWAERKKGVVNQKFDISRDELNCVLPYLEKYQHLLKEYNIESTYSQEKVLAKYMINEDQSFRTRPFYGLNPILIVNHAEKMQHQIKNIEKQLEQDICLLQLEKDNAAKLLEEQLRINESLPGVIHSQQRLLEEVKTNLIGRIWKSIKRAFHC